MPSQFFGRSLGGLATAEPNYQQIVRSSIRHVVKDFVTPTPLHTYTLARIWDEPNKTKTVHLRLFDPDDSSAPDTKEEPPIDSDDGEI